METPNYISQPLFAVCAFITLLFISSAAAQNVGIGVSNPQSKLTVNGSTASGGIAVGDSTFNVPAPANGAIIQGPVGIGNTAPVTALDVNHGTASVSSGAFPNSVNRFVIGWDVLQPGLGVAEFVNYFGTGGGDSFRFYFLSTGAPTTANLIASIDRSGGYHAVSDQRIKTDAQRLHYGLKEVMALKPMEYDLHVGNTFEKGDLVLGKQSVHKIGFLAQDVYHLIPEAVTKPNDAKSDLYTMDYTALLPPLVNAIQEVKREKDSEITKLQAENASQRAELGQLSRQIPKLKTENAKLSAIIAKVENLEKAVNSLQLKADIKPVALIH
jgi:Chaperone of endosialidase